MYLIYTTYIIHYVKRYIVKRRNITRELRYFEAILGGVKDGK